MARQYHVERGEPARDKVIGRWTSYHGATLGGLSVGGRRAAGARSTSRCSCDMPHIPPIYCYRCPFGPDLPDVPGHVRRRAGARDPARRARARRRVHRRADRRVGRRRDPAPARVLPEDPRDLRSLRRAADRRRGHHRASGGPGRNFGIEHYGVVPDLMVMGKGISSGLRAAGRGRRPRPRPRRRSSKRTSPSSTSSRTAATRWPRPRASPSSTSAAASTSSSTPRSSRRCSPRPRRACASSRSSATSGRSASWPASSSWRTGRRGCRSRRRQGRGQGPRGGPAERDRDLPGHGHGRRQERRHHLALPAADVHAGRHRRHGRAPPARRSRTWPRELGRPDDDRPESIPAARSSSMDHSVITLREGGGRTVRDGVPVLLRHPLLDAARRRSRGAACGCRRPASTSSSPIGWSSGAGCRRACEGMGTTMTMLDREPVIVTDVRRDPWVRRLVRLPVRGRRASTSTPAGSDLDAPFFAEGPAPGFSDTEDIWSLFVGGWRASIVVNGVAAPGAPYDDDVWLPKLGRSVSSAHSALGETRITPHPGRRPG